MAQMRREGDRRKKLKHRFTKSKTLFWSWLTDPAVLLYRREAHGRRRARVLTVEFFLFVREVAREFYDIQGTNRAASLAYTTLLSLIPLLVAFTQVLQHYFRSLFPNLQTQIDTMLNNVIPYQSPVISYHLAKFAENASTASTFGVIIFIVIAFRLFLLVEDTINDIWKVRNVRGYRQKIMAFTMLFFWGPILMGFSFTTSGMLQRNRYLRIFFKHDLIFNIAPIVILFIAFAMLFWLVPSMRVKFSAAAVGAVVTTSLFSLVRFGFGLYAQFLIHGRFNIIYGTLGLAIVFLLAIEVMWVVILLGVEISFVYQNLYGLLRASAQQIEDDERYDLYFGIRALVEVSRRFDKREDAPSSYRLAEQFGTTDSQMMRVLRRLQDGKLVREVGGEWAGFVPGCDPDRIAVEEVVRQVEGEHRAIPGIRVEERERVMVQDLFNQMQDCLSNALVSVSVGQLVRDLYGERAPSRDSDALPQP